MPCPSSRVRVVLFALCLSGGSMPSEAQTQLPPPLDRPLRVFIDCRSNGCDEEFFRTELHWIDHVRDQRDADIHLLITQQQTGGGGNEYTVRLIGQGRWEGRDEVVRTSTEAGEPQDALRRTLARVFALMLARYALETPVGPKLTLTPPAAVAGVQTTAAEDPWNFWVFRINFNSFINGEQNSQYGNFNFGTSANRTTEASKINLDAGFSYSENRYELSDGRFVSYVKSHRANAVFVKSLTDHWSAAGMVRASRDSYENQRLDLRIAPGIEYNFFRWAESTNRQLSLQWTAGFRRFKYDEVTIYDKVEENRWDQQLLAILSLRQPFGTVRITGEAASYLDNAEQRRFAIFADNEVRLFRGFSFNVDGNYQLIHDQIYLPRTGASDEEIIARQQQLATSYRYFMFLGITYRFGSINNNVVNQRFGG